VIIPDEIFPDRAHPDIRIARRSLTVSLLAKNIAERKVSKGLRQALHVQTRRLEDLARLRNDALAGTPDDPDADTIGDHEIDQRRLPATFRISRGSRSYPLRRSAVRRPTSAMSKSTPYPTLMPSSGRRVSTP
jgi:hypothetical protein